MTIWDDNAFIGGHPALDFLNTVDDQDKQRKMSRIADWPSFLEWCQASTMFSEMQQEILRNDFQTAEIQPLLNQIHTFRETAYAALISAIAGENIPDTNMQTLESHIKTAINRASFTSEGTGYRWLPDSNNSDWITDVISLSFEKLLRSEDISKLRECKRCSWLFLNKGRGKGRQWCNMNTCGNRAKSASFRNRQH